MSERFSKKTLREWVDQQLRSLENAHHFTTQTGWSQVDGEGESENRAYGRFDMLLTLKDAFEL